LPLVPFERYMLTDDRPDYPMTIPVITHPSRRKTIKRPTKSLPPKAPPTEFDEAEPIRLGVR